MMQVQDYGCEVVRPFMQFSPGFVMYPTGLYREKLIRAGWVRPLLAPATQTASVQEPAPSLDQLRARKTPRLVR